MAILQEPNHHPHPFAEQIGDSLPPVGTHPATVIAVRDVFGAQRRRFESQEMETVDLTCFLFGFRDPQGVPHRIASKQMKISGNEKSALFLFLKSLLGKAPPYNWDYCTLKGMRCFVTVEHVQRRDGSGVLASIAALSPMPQGYDPVPVVPAAMPPPQPARPAPVAQPAPFAPAAEDEAPF